jgi:hypothetical protein
MFKLVTKQEKEMIPVWIE